MHKLLVDFRRCLEGTYHAIDETGPVGMFAKLRAQFTLKKHTHGLFSRSNHRVGVRQVKPRRNPGKVRFYLAFRWLLGTTGSGRTSRFSCGAGPSRGQ